jgi:hypothetical protein
MIRKWKWPKKPEVDWGCLALLLSPFAILIAIPLILYIFCYCAGFAGSVLAMPLFSLTCGKVATSSSQSILAVPDAQDYVTFLYNKGCAAPVEKTSNDQPVLPDYSNEELEIGRQVGATNDPHAGIQELPWWKDPFDYYMHHFVEMNASDRFSLGVEDGAVQLVSYLAKGPIDKAFYYVAYTIFLIVSAEFVRMAAVGFARGVAERLGN